LMSKPLAEGLDWKASGLRAFDAKPEGGSCGKNLK
jgi:hypothetical protein